MILFGGLCAEQHTNLGYICLSPGASEKPIMPDAMEAIWKHMDQEAADELARGEAHDGSPPFMVCGQTTAGQWVTVLDPIVFPSERNNVGVGADEAAVRDRHTMGVAAEIGQNSLRASERRFGIDYPFRFAQRCEVGGEGISV